MARFKGLYYYRVKKALANKDNDSGLNLKIYEKGRVDSNVKSISVYSEHVAIAYGKTVLFKLLGDYDYHKTYQCLDDVNVVKFRDQGMLLIGLQNGIIEYVAVCSMQRMGMLKGHTAAVNDIAFCPDFKYIFTCSRDGTIKKWNMWSKACELTLDYHTDTVKNILVHNYRKKKKYLISSGYDGNIYFYNFEKNKRRNKLKIEQKDPIEHMFVFHNKYIIFSVKNVVKVYSFRSKKIIKEFCFCSKTVYYLSGVKNYILAASLNNYIYFIDPYKGMKEEAVSVIENFRYFHKQLLLDVYKNVFALGDKFNKWFILVCETQALKTVKNNSKDVCLGELITENTKYQLKPVDTLLKRFKFKDALFFCIKNDSNCCMPLLDFMSKIRVLDTVCEFKNTAEMLYFLKWILRTNVISDLTLEILGIFLNVNKTNFIKDKQIEIHLRQLLNTLEAVQLWLKAYENLEVIVQQLTM